MPNSLTAQMHSDSAWVPTFLWTFGLYFYHGSIMVFHSLCNSFLTNAVGCGKNTDLNLPLLPLPNIATMCGNFLKQPDRIHLSEIRTKMVCALPLCVLHHFLLKLLDFEKKKVYTLKVEASNPHVEPRFLYLGPFKDSATVRIVVDDVDEPPVFSKLAYILQIREDAQINTTIGSVSAQDPDAARNPVK